MTPFADRFRGASARLAAGALLLFLTASAAQAQSTSTVVISQVYGGGGNTGAPFRNDFIELYNRGAEPVPIDGWSVQYASAAGGVWQVTNISGTLQPGQYYLVQQAQGANAALPALPTPDATGAIAMSATGAKVALVNSQTPLACGAAAGNCFPNPAIQDFVGYGGANNFEGTAAAPGLSNSTAAARRSQGCTDTDNNFNDFSEATPTPRNTAVIDPGCEPPPPPVCTPDTTIAAVQGSGQSSPVAGTVVSVAGLVTGRITLGSARGIFLQMAEGDGNPATSDGVFVFTGSTTPPADAAVGNEVCVTGEVVEFIPTADPRSLPTTEISRPTVFTLLGTPGTVPAAIELTAADAPANNPEALERFEGMRVRIGALTVVAPTDAFVDQPNASSLSNGLFFGVIEGVARPFREPGIDVFDVLAATAPATVPRFDSNPERIRVDSDLLGAPVIDVSSGARVSNLLGVLHYGFRTWTLLPELSNAGSVGIAGNNVAAAPVGAPTSREFTVASTNLERFFDTVDDPGDDTIVTQAALDRRLAKISLAIRNVLKSPDVVAVEEAENLTLLQALATKVNADTVLAGLADPNYQAFLAEGNDPGGIDVGFLVKTARVTVLDVEQVGKDATYVQPDGATATLNDRPPLVLRAVINLPAGALPVTVIANHLRSLIDVELANATGARVRAKRAAQAEFLASYIQSRQQADPAERIVLMGDFNAFQFNDGYADVIGTIKGTPTPASEVLVVSPDLVTPDFVDAIEAIDPVRRYSFVFDGSAQVLDHVLLNPSALANLTRIDLARVNADFAEVLRNDATRPERFSDHDIPVAYFQIMPDNVTASTQSVSTPFVRIPFTNIYLGLVLVQNNSPSPIPGPVHVVFDGLAPGVKITNANGNLLGSPYIVAALHGLRPRQIVAVPVIVTKPANVPINYTLRVVSGAF